MNYYTFEIVIAAKEGLRFLDVLAVDLQAAIADVEQAFYNVEIVYVNFKG